MNYRHTREYQGYLEKACELADHMPSQTHEFGEWLNKNFFYGDLCCPEFSYTSGVHFLMSMKSLSDLLMRRQSSNQLSALLHKQIEMTKNSIPRPRMAFFTQEFFLWSSFQSVWEAYQGIADTDLVFVYDLNAEAHLNGKENAADKQKMEIAAYKKSGYPILTMKEYDLQAVSPDVVFYMKPYKYFRGCPDDWFVKTVKKMTPYTVFISYCLDVQGGEELRKYFYEQPAFYYMWRIIGYSDYYKKMMTRYGFRNGENVVTLGHPKFDCSYDLISHKAFVYPEWEKKIAGRPVIFWNSHFSVLPENGVGTFIQWSRLIFSYFKNNSDAVLLWRPHPLFWETIQQNYPEQNAEFEAFVKDLETWPNVIVDRTEDYRYAFSMSDALISDAATFLVEYCASGKPVLYTEKKNGEKVCCEDYLVGLQIARTEDDIIDFIGEVKTGRITGSEIREKQFKKIFGSCDGKAGQRISEYVLKEMDFDIGERVKNRLVRFGEENRDALE